MIEIAASETVTPGPTRRGPVRAVDPRLRTCLRNLLQSRHDGMERAATWEQLRQELVAEGLQVGVVRRLQEAVSEMAEDEGLPIVGLSGAGVFWARRASEIEAALAEADKRARKTLRKRRLLRRAWLAMRGQSDLLPPIDDGSTPA